MTHKDQTSVLEEYYSSFKHWGLINKVVPICAVWFYKAFKNSSAIFFDLPKSVILTNIFFSKLTIL